MSKIEKEKATVTFMIRYYCKHKHNTKALCDNCKELNLYAQQRLTKCRYGEQKKACRNCSTHCYNPNMRQQIKEVMRYVGPRMIFYAPFLSLKHWLKK